MYGFVGVLAVDGLVVMLSRVLESEAHQHSYHTIKVSCLLFHHFLCTLRNLECLFFAFLMRTKNMPTT